MTILKWRVALHATATLPVMMWPVIVPERTASMDGWDLTVKLVGRRVTHICVNKLTIIGSDNGLSPGRRQAIIWTNAGISLIRNLGRNVSEILAKFIHFHSRKCIWKCRLRNGVYLVSASMSLWEHYQGSIDVNHVLKHCHYGPVFDYNQPDDDDYEIICLILVRY